MEFGGIWETKLKQCVSVNWSKRLIYLVHHAPSAWSMYRSSTSQACSRESREIGSESIVAWSNIKIKFTWTHRTERL